MKIGILLTGHAVPEMKDKLGDYDSMFVDLLSGRGYDFETWNVVDNEVPDSAAAADGWLITGSKHGAYEDHAWIPPLEKLIREIQAREQPLVGVCFGHQIIAQALGGTVEKFAGGWAVGPQVYQFEGASIALNAWHQDQVTRLPADAEVIGHNDFCAYAALRLGDNTLTVQAHPEYDSRALDFLLKYRAPGVVPDQQIKQAMATLDTPLDSKRMADHMAAVFDRSTK